MQNIDNYIWFHSIEVCEKKHLNCVEINNINNNKYTKFTTTRGQAISIVDCVDLTYWYRTTIPMDTAWRFRLVLIMTFAIIIFGDMLGYANVKGDKDSNQRSVDSTLKKNNPNHNSHHNVEGIIIYYYSSKYFCHLPHFNGGRTLCYGERDFACQTKKKNEEFVQYRDVYRLWFIFAVFSVNLIFFQICLFSIWLYWFNLSSTILISESFLLRLCNNLEVMTSIHVSEKSIAQIITSFFWNTSIHFQIDQIGIISRQIPKKKREKNSRQFSHDLLSPNNNCQIKS